MFHGFFGHFVNAAAPKFVLDESEVPLAPIGFEGSSSVLSLFRDDPFKGKPPSMVRTVLWQYWFTDLKTKRKTGAWWRRQEIGPFSPSVTRGNDGRPEVNPVSSP